MRILLSLLACLFITAPASAQEVTDLFDGYSCARYADGSQYIVRRTETGTSVFQPRDVSKPLVNERRRLRSRIASLKKIRADLVRFAESVTELGRKQFKRAAKLLSKFLAQEYPDGGAPPIETTSLKIQAIEELARVVGADLETVDFKLDLLNRCAEGVQIYRGRGTPLSPNVRIVQARTSRYLYTAFLISAPALPNPNNPRPGGYNVCLKFVNNDGTGNTFYTGFGTEDLCVGSVAAQLPFLDQATCDSFLPRGEAGYMWKVSESLDQSEEAREREYLAALRVQPLFLVLALNNLNISRDKAVALCNSF